MRKGFVGLLLALALAAVGLAGASQAGAQILNPGFNMGCDTNADHCTGWVQIAAQNFQNYHEWTHTFDPTGAAVWNTTALQYYICSPGCIGGNYDHPVGWVLHAITYDYATPHMQVNHHSTYDASTLVFEGYAVAATFGGLRWQSCPGVSSSPYNFSGIRNGANGDFYCYSSNQWWQGGGWEWMNSTWTNFVTGADTDGNYRVWFVFG